MLIEGRYSITICFLNDILGSAPANKQFYEKYLLSKLLKEIDKTKKKIAKAKTEEERRILQDLLENLEAEVAEIPEVEDNEDSRLTVFYRANYEDFLVPVIRGHQILGFFKHGMNAFKDVFGVKNPREKVSRYVRVRPFNIFIYEKELSPENLVDDVDGILERPLRALTPQGERISVVKSEFIKSNQDKIIQFEVILFKNKDITFDMLETLMREYGKFNGISQWRNTGFYGSFEVLEVRELESEEVFALS